MKPQVRASTVLERTSHYLKVGVLKEKPAWFDVVGAHPPILDLSKKPKKIDLKQTDIDPSLKLDNDKGSVEGKFFKTRMNSTDRKQQHNAISRIPKLQFLEDELRDVFYHQHPWEFSRPKNLIENQGDEYKNLDWSHMLQFTKPLDGESVVQRTLWILTNQNNEININNNNNNNESPKITLFEAYDKARFEFYRLRMEEEMNSAVSREESTMYGAIYPSTNLEWGVKNEQEYIDLWAKIAEEKTRVLEASRERNNSTASGKSTKGGETGLEDLIDSSSIWEQNFSSDIAGAKAKSKLNDSK
ncbi:37S ribosomal protein S25, mitochondrial [Scheffersomyces coipomensis]|uniref:37S ribosomal protein S25, mitochondrial n=1 Tax=Scheffersomyces coipomensis TaxID=1788519 RepID=UPI00315DEDE2